MNGKNKLSVKGRTSGKFETAPDNTAVDREECTFVALLAKADFARDLEQLRTMLGPSWRVEGKRTGVEAVHHMMEHGLPSLLITEPDFPAMSGLELIQWVRAMQVSTHIPVVVQTSAPNSIIENRCRNAGADEFVFDSQGVRKWEPTLRLLREEIGKGASYLLPGSSSFEN